MNPMPRRRPLALAALLLSACSSAPAPSAAPAGEPATLALVGVHVLPMTPGVGVLPNHTVLVRGGRIAMIGPAGDVQVPPGALRIEGEGRYLMPGLADMHVHLEYSRDPELLKLFLANGVTTVRSMDGRPYILGWKRAVAAGELLAPTIYTAGPLLDGDPPLRDDNTVVRTAEEARAEVLAQADAGYDFVKVYGNLSEEAYRAVLAAAAERGLPVAGHLPRGVTVEEALRSGQRSIEHAATFGEAVEADDSPFRDRFHWSKLFLAMPVDSARMEAVAREAARSGAWITPTLIQAERGLAPPDSVAAWIAAPETALLPRDAVEFWKAEAERNASRMDAADWERVRRGRENRERLVRTLYRAGARLLVGTDTPNPFVVPGFSVLGELRSFVDAGLPRSAVLAAATRGAAEALGEIEEFGTVEAGKRADLLLLSGNPLEDLDALRNPEGVMVRGRFCSIGVGSGPGGGGAGLPCGLAPHEPAGAPGDLPTPGAPAGARTGG